MAEDAKAVAEIHAAVGEWHSIERSFVKAYVGLACEFPFATVKARNSHPRSADGRAAAPPVRPTARCRSRHRTHGILREALPGKDCEILFEQPQ